MLSDDELDTVRLEYTRPFYLTMRRDGFALAPRVVELARAATEEQVLFMLETEEWRSRKMGAWFSLVRSESSVAAAVLRSLETSRGALTAPELSVAAIIIHGVDALPSLTLYESSAIASNWGGHDETAAAIRIVGGHPAGGDAEVGAGSFAELLRLGRSIHNAR